MLRKTLHWALPGLLLGSAPLIVLADDGPYVGVEGGFNWEESQDLRQDRVVTDKINFDKGWAAGLIGGYSFANGLRPELELNHRSNDLNHDYLGTAYGLDRAESAFANLWYDVKAPTGLFSVVHPYLGGGVGGVRSYYHNANLGGFPINPDYATELGYQAGAGVGFDLTRHLTLSFDYRHVWTNRGAFAPQVGVPLETAYPIEQRYLADTAMLSVRYAFGSPPAEVPAPLPAPPPPPPLPPPLPPPPPPPVAVAPAPCSAPAGFQVDANCRIIQQTVVVRAVDFEFNSARLTAPAQQTLDEVATALAAQPDLRIEIQGYTDSVGADAYNLRLSQRRADAVKFYLVSKGANGSALSARGYGKANPLVSNDTAENRAKNRRVAFEVTNAPANVKVEKQDATPASTEAAQQGAH
jgi:outer membrane protein OmpA-like peptidoglycan-associated protein/outer membrane protein W